MRTFHAPKGKLEASYAPPKGGSEGATRGKNESVGLAFLYVDKSHLSRWSGRNAASRPIRTLQFFPTRGRVDAPHRPASRPIKTLKFFPRVALWV